MQSRELIVVIPVFNEAARLNALVGDWVAELQRLKINYEIRIYNDASTDETAAQLNLLAQQNPTIRVIHAEVNRGHGPVLYLAFSEATTAQWVFQIDGDHELACNAFERLWNERQSFDLLLGSRVSMHTNVFRKLITVTARQMVQFLFGSAVADVNCPYRLIRNSFLQQALQQIRANAFAPNVLLVALAIAGKNRIFNTPITFTGHTKRQTRWQPPWRMLRGAVTAAFDLMRMRF